MVFFIKKKQEIFLRKYEDMKEEEQYELSGGGITLTSKDL